MANNNAGVYYIVNTCNNKMYIGQTRHIATRFQQHIAALQGNYHSNVLLQLEWNIYGKMCFELGVLTTSPEYLFKWRRSEIEKLFIRAYQSDRFQFGYNINPVLISHYRRSKQAAQERPPL